MAEDMIPGESNIDFREIAITDKRTFDDFFARYPPKASECTFTSLFCWRLADNLKFAVYKEHLLILSVCDKGLVFYQPMGPEPLAMIRELLDLYPGSSFGIVEKEIAGQLRDGYEIGDERDMADYVYSLNDLRLLKGAKYDAKRNFVKKFMGYFPDVCELNEGNVNEFLQMEEAWCRMKDCGSSKGLSDEDFAVREALMHFRDLNLFGVCFRIWGKLEGFAIGEKLNDDTFVEHFEKAHLNFNGIYQALLHEFAKKIPAGFQFLNREQDLGVEGLKKEKESYHPVKMIEKFSIKRLS